ncbi:MAG: hypothetical protein R3Y63_04500 [Eubacteriales bacterium]
MGTIGDMTLEEFVNWYQADNQHSLLTSKNLKNLYEVYALLYYFVEKTDITKKLEELVGITEGAINQGLSNFANKHSRQHLTIPHSRL